MRYFTLLLALLGLIACQQSPKMETAIELDNSAQLAENKPVYAKNYRVEQLDNARKITVMNPWQGAQEQFSYYLYPSSQYPDKENAGKVQIPVPARRIVCLSTTQAAMLQVIGAADNIVGLSNTKFVYDEYLQKRIAAGQIKEVGDGSNLDYEAIVALKPDLVFAFGMGNADDVYQKLQALGLNVVLTAEYTERTPLGRAEWMRFMGEFTMQTDTATKLFLSRASEYESLVKFKLNEHKPNVLVGMPYKGTWYMPGGDSYVAQYIKDAGGNYLFKSGAGQGSVPMRFEDVFVKAAEADVWLDVMTAQSLDDIEGNDRRLVHVKAFQDRQVYNYTKRISSQGGYDIYESAVVEPQKVLADFMKMIHGDLFGEHQLFYYEHLMSKDKPR